jgi:hypothetical protein
VVSFFGTVFGVVCEGIIGFFVGFGAWIKTVRNGKFSCNFKGLS